MKYNQSIHSPRYSPVVIGATGKYLGIKELYLNLFDGDRRKIFCGEASGVSSPIQFGRGGEMVM